MTWQERTFIALDSEGRGYIFRDEILDHIIASGTRTNKQLDSLVHDLESLQPCAQINYDTFNQLI